MKTNHTTKARKRNLLRGVANNFWPVLMHTADQKSCALALRLVAPFIVRWRICILMSAS
jgi:hypothetical protein